MSLLVYCVVCGKLVKRSLSRVPKNGNVYCDVNCRRQRTIWNKGKAGCYTPETLAKIGAAGRGRTPWNKGKALSAEHRAKLCIARQRRLMSGETHPMKGKHWSEEIRKNMSEAMKLRYQTQPAKKGAETPMYGTKWAEGRREKHIEFMRQWWDTHPSAEILRQKIKLSGPWNKGKNGIYSALTIEKIRAARLRQIFPTKDTKPEKALFAILEHQAIVYLKHVALTGQPDCFILPNICIFVDGDYWHANPQKYKATDMIKNRRTAESIWKRDAEITEDLRRQGCVVLRFWASDILKNPEQVIQTILRTVGVTPLLA